MKIIFTEEDVYIHRRARYMRGGLIKNYHHVKTVRDYSNIPDSDIWFHGISAIPGWKDFSFLYEKMESYKGKLVLFQNNDGLEFNVERIPESLIKKTVMFLRNTWPSDNSKIHSLIRDRIGLFNPFVNPGNSAAGKDLVKRSINVGFLGAATRFCEFSRVNALQILKAAGISVFGGIFRAHKSTDEIPEELLTPQIKKKDYLRSLGDTRISLALHGYNPLTFRLFESLSRRCLVIVQDLSDIKFADCGLTPGVHYVVAKKDLSDLTSLVKYYLENHVEAQRIADSGYDFFRKHFQYSGVALAQSLFEDITGTWGKLEMKEGKVTPVTLLARRLAPYIKSM